MTRKRRIAARSIAILVASTLCACTGHTGPKRTITAQTKSHYIVGMDELLSGNYTEAITAFQQVVKSPGYIKYAALARLRIGDSLFLQEKYDAAIEHYRAFIKQYEGNANVGYARFRIGHAFFEQIPSDWFLAPPSHERQQIFVKHAANSLRRFVALYPTHRLVNQAQEMLDDCERKLYEHELYVAQFYFKRQKPAGVVQRLETAFRKFPDLAGTEDNYMMLANAYAKTKRVDEATAMYQAYLDRFPSGVFGDQATESLEVLRSKNGGK